MYILRSSLGIPWLAFLNCLIIDKSWSSCFVIDQHLNSYFNSFVCDLLFLLKSCYIGALSGMWRYRLREFNNDLFLLQRSQRTYVRSFSFLVYILYVWFWLYNSLVCIFSYCAKIYLKSPPDMWLCEDCRSSARVLHIPSLVDKDITIDHGASSSKISGESSGKGSSSYTSPSKNHKPPFLAFPSPKRKRRTPRVPGKICCVVQFLPEKTRLCFCACVSNCVIFFL